jgi:hypothetical protein
MSVKATTWAWYDSKAEGADLLVLLALADFADETGRCFGSWGTMQRKTKLARSTIARCIKRLEASGELTVIEGAKTLNGRNLATVWQLPVKGGCQNETGLNVTLPPSDSDTTPGPILTLPPSDSDTPTQSNVLKRSLTNTPAISSPSSPTLEAKASKPKKAPASKFDPSTLPLPHGPGFAAAWVELIEHKRQKRSPLTEIGARKLLKQLAEFNERDAVEKIDRAIVNNYSGVVFPNELRELRQRRQPVTLPPQGAPKQSALERSLAEMRAKYGKEHAA